MGRQFAGLTLTLTGVAVIGIASPWSTHAAPPADKLVSAIDLAKPFGARSDWRLTLTQAPDVPDPDFGPQPGLITACLKRVGDRACDAALDAFRSTYTPDGKIDWQPHYLKAARIVYPRGPSMPPLLLLQTSGERSANNNAAEYTQLLAYRRATDRFETVFAQVVGHNNNEEIRFVDAGPLRGDVVVVAPAEKAPWSYWISVHRSDSSYSYRQVLRYRSATQYGDGNPITVIDSEMPNILQRLSLWRPGMPLPVPKGCAKPRLVKMELWCS